MSSFVPHAGYGTPRHADGTPISEYIAQGEQVNYGAAANVTYRSAACDEVQCPGYREGWATIADEAVDQGASIAHYIRTGSGRRFTQLTGAAWNERCAEECARRNAAKDWTLETTTADVYEPIGEALTVFVFEAGQPCFSASQHVMPVAANPVFVVRDHDGHLLRKHSGVDAFTDDFRTHHEAQLRLITN